MMSAIKGHFDGTSVVLDEPASLVVGQPVLIVVTNHPTDQTSPREQPSVMGSWKGRVEILDDGDDVILEHFKDYLP
jgi:hypothetical protein